MAPCFCLCRSLNCVTLLRVYDDGSHEHYPDIPCVDRRMDGVPRETVPPPRKSRAKNARRILGWVKRKARERAEEDARHA